MENFEKRLDDYAKLIVEVGVNVQKGQPVEIRIAADQYVLAEKLTKAAYEAGASSVRVDFNHQPLSLLHNQYKTVEKLAEVSAEDKARLEYSVENLPAMIAITSADPDGLKGMDMAKQQKASAIRYPIIKPYIDKMESKYQWVIAGAASPAWAKKVFPDLPADEALAALWDAIFKTSRMEAGTDPVKNWEKHNASFKAHMDWLNEQHFDYLHYKSAQGTDFKAWLNPKVKWLGGGENLHGGPERFGHEVFYNPNMPTEEIFTTPMKAKAEGTVYSTKPLSYMGQLIENFSITFKEGKAVEWQAESGAEVLDKMITMDENAAYIGELALVPDSSPISQSGILFYNTLYDENASCHIALGAGFPDLYEDYEKYSREELEKLGVNDSMIHVDFMIGSDELDIDGYTQDGKCVPIFRKGEWAFEV
jgi:aminopeptidase